MASTTNKMDNFVIGVSEGGGARFAAPTATASPAPASASAGASAIASFGPIAAKGAAVLSAIWNKEEEAAKVEQRTQAENTITKDLSQKIEAIDVARNSGRMTATAASANARSVYQDYISQYPGYKETIDKFFEGSNAYGIGSGIKAAAQSEDDAFKAAQKDGFGSIYDSEEQRAEAVIAHQKFLNAKSGLEVLTQQASLTKLKTETQMLNFKIEAENSMRNFVAKSLPIYQSNLNHLINEVSTGKMSVEEANNAATKLVADARIGMAQSVGGWVDQSQISNVTSILERGLGDFRDRLTGKITQDVLDARLKRIATETELHIMDSSPSMATAAVMSKMAPNSPGVASLIATEANAYYSKVKQAEIKGPPPNVVENTPANKAYLNDLKSGIKGTDDVSVFKNQVNETLRGLHVFGEYAENVKDLNPVIDFIASNEFRDYITKGGELMPDAVSKGSQAAGRFYKENVMQAIKDELLKKEITVMPADIDKSVNPFLPSKAVSTPASEQIRLVNDNGVFKFEAASAVGPVPYAIQRNAEMKVAGLNKDVAPLLNKMTKLQAHLEGKTDYTSAAKQLELEFYRTIGQEAPPKDVDTQ